METDEHGVLTQAELERVREGKAKVTFSLRLPTLKDPVREARQRFSIEEKPGRITIHYPACQEAKVAALKREVHASVEKLWEVYPRIVSMGCLYLL